MKHQNLSKKEKKKQHYGHERYQNLSEDEKQKLVGYRKKYYRIRNQCFNMIIRKYFNLENFVSLYGNSTNINCEVFYF